ncbi:HET domain-containing protein [Fusarium sp. LHS14.1]|nr:HET domain-containing protein [Fusarium sp. LHS14.1]
MAKRKIIFNNLELHWVCGCSVWHEELTSYTEIDEETLTHSNIVMAGFPDDSSLQRYLNAYNQRSLTFDEDALPAVSGLLSGFGRSFQGGFLYGIPEMFFEHSLGWRPDLNGGLQRRVPSGRPIEDKFTSSGLPSWSWLGWKGSIDTRCQTAIRVDSNYSTSDAYVEEAFLITEWYTSRSPTDPLDKRRRIRSTWYEKRDGYKDFARPMPPGWTRRDAVTVPSLHNEPRLYPDGCDIYIFQHEALLENWERPLEWYYPFPVGDIQESTPPFMPEQTEYLFCVTVRAQLSGYQQDSHQLQYSCELEAKLCYGLGKAVGKLHLNNKDSWDLFPECVDGSETGLPVDVVAVCKLKRYSKTWNRAERSVGLPLIKEELYLVLWVEWKDGVAYRLASGEVIAAEWEKLDLEGVSLILN